MTITLFSFQKNTDLHALSAGATMTQFLKCDAIKGCRRFVLWDIDVESNSPKEWIDSVLSKTYYLLNPNKEDYFLSSIPAKRKHNGFHVLIQISNSVFENQAELAQKINKKCQTTISSLKKSLVWDLFVEKDSYQEAETYIKSMLLDSSSHPFLLNPIFESATLLDSKMFLNED